MSWLSDFFHPGRAYENAGNAENAGYNEGKGMRQPYMENGIGAGNTLQEMLNKLKNPGQLQNEWSEGYETSPYAKQLQAQSQTGGLDAASAMGLGGSSAALSNIQKGAGDIVQKDRQNYMNDLMQKYMSGIGLGENIYGTGANTANQGAGAAQSHGEWQGQNEFNKTSAGPNQLKQIISMIKAMTAAANGADSGGSGWNDPGALPGWE